VRFPLLALLNLVAIAMASGQWQPMPVPAVAGHPFSADEVTPRVLSPNLKDIVPSTSRVYRDSAGRTRIDVAFPRGRAGPPPIAVILDPIAGITYSLEYRNKDRTAIRLHSGTRAPNYRRPMETANRAARES
jgi:hypothetical protein